ncbi:MAG: phosphatidylserine/phosphatidylglycerophosphate/cardiolipin synthase family protein [Pseudobacteriovorax sp.]|nr:phosphatidylserine/phosphatidylglycerophosphate/cardiolipin synthase family protein [Pseudobacteriovorax sp.]
MRPFASISCALIVGVSLVSSAVSLTSRAFGQEALCQQPQMDLKPYLYPNQQCVDPRHFDSSAEANKRKLYRPIPCNNVVRVFSDPDTFGPTTSNDLDAILESNHFQIFRNWLGETDRFQDSLDLLAEIEGGRLGNPILDTAHALAIKSLIQGAKSSLFIDIFLFGGTWGVDIAGDVLDAAARGVEVVIIHDTESVFAVGNEVRPLWNELRQLAAVTPNLVALDSNITPPGRPSSVPFGIQGILGGLGLGSGDINIEGYSDHSKLIIADAIYSTGMADYMDELEPKVLISSKNWVDSAASTYHDESVIVSGPAAVAAMFHYREDIFFALQQRLQSGPNLDRSDRGLVESWLEKLDRFDAVAALPVKNLGTISVEPIQVNGNDSVRNLDAGIITKIAQARTSIDLYGKLAYGDSFAKALGEAMRRGVRVRVILDQQKPGNLNTLLPILLSRYSGIREKNLEVYWHLPFRPALATDDDGRTDLFQEIHAKTIIIDQKLSLFGSTNFDSLTWAGGFREYSAWIYDEGIAKESAAMFQRFIDHPLLTVPHAVWLDKQDVDPRTIDYFEDLKVELADLVDCNRSNDACDYESVIYGSKEISFFQRIALEGVAEALKAESDRIKQVYSSDLLTNPDGSLSCQL